MKFQARANKEGTGLNFAPKERIKFLEYLKNHKTIVLTIEARFPESTKQRRFYFGAVLALWVYLDGKNYKNSDLINMYHEMAKIEFNGAVVISRGKSVRVGKSSKGELNQGFLEKVIEHLEENYGIDASKCLNPAVFKDFEDRVLMNGKYEDFIDYMKDLKIIPAITSN